MYKCTHVSVWTGAHRPKMFPWKSLHHPRRRNFTHQSWIEVDMQWLYEILYLLLQAFWEIHTQCKDEKSTTVWQINAFFHLLHPEEQQYQNEENGAHETRPLRCCSCKLGHPCCRNQCQIRILHSWESVSTMTPVWHTSTSVAEKGNKTPSCAWWDFWSVEKGLGHSSSDSISWGLKINFTFAPKRWQSLFLGFPVWYNAKDSWSTNQQESFCSELKSQN